MMQSYGLFTSAVLVVLWCILPRHAWSLMARNTGPIAWRETEIDYSAANKYIRSHYKTQQLSDPYFSRVDKDGKAMESIYDARKGFWDDDDDDEAGHLVEPSLKRCGFILQHAPTKVTDFKDLEQIQAWYLPQLRSKVIPEAFPNEKISDIVFWNPMFRGDDQVMSEGNIHESEQEGALPTASIASMVHIDTDFGAFDGTDEIVRLVANNRFDDTEQARSFSSEALQDVLASGRRFCIVNLWRNINLHQPVLRAPLAVLSTQYMYACDDSLKRYCFPDAKPNPSTSRWYTFPSMTTDECLLFLQYDRDIQRPSDLWHCALASIKEPGAQPRRSFDVRALVVFQDVVPPHRDRFAQDRTRPHLTRQESECFCEDQAQTEGKKIQELVEKMRQQ
jgi:hypothetical protein